MKTTTKYLIAFTAFITIAISCNKDDDDDGGASENIEAKEITSFAFAVSDNEALEADIQGIINQDVKTIAVTVPYETNITALTPVIEVSRGASYTPEGPQDFTEPVTYNVTAQNGSSAEYTVTVLVAENDDVQILSFQFLASENSSLTQNINTIINIDDYSITATVPYGTNITALNPEITTSTGAVYAPEGAQDFTEPVEYTVTAANGEITQTYTVTVTTVEPAGALELQWQALMDIYDASYDNFYQLHYLDWDISNPDISTWEGITTDADGYVTELILIRKIPTNSIPESIGNLIRLQVLNITENKLTTLPTSIGNLSQLRQLILGPNQLTELPSTIGGLSRLQELHINNCNLTDLPPSFSDLKSLQVLDIGNNNFTEVPESLQGVAGNLISLNMSENDFSGGLPEWIGDFTALEELSLYNCHLPGLPASYQNLWRLRVLDLGGLGSNGNQLSSSPILVMFHRLERLSLQGNNLEIIPILPTVITTLTHVNFSDNRFLYFPVGIGEFSELQSLDFSNNLFYESPDALMDLEKLTFIDLTRNNFGELSGDLCEYLAGIEEHHMDEDACP